MGNSNKNNGKNIRRNKPKTENKTNPNAEQKQKADIKDREPQTHKPYDKTFREILSVKKEAAFLINEMLKPTIKLKETDIEPYSTNYITERYKELQADIVYKIINKKIVKGSVFILLEHQSKEDKNIRTRMEKYEREIIRRERKNNKDRYEPLVIKLLLYTGKDEWKSSLQKSDKKAEWKSIEYNKKDIIMLDNYRNTNEEWEKANYAIAKVLMLEKLQGNQKSDEAIENINLDGLLEDQEDMIFAYVYNVSHKEGLTEEEKAKIIKKLKKGGQKMLMLAEKIKQEKEEKKAEGILIGRNEGILIGRSEGIEQTHIETAKKMKNKEIPMEIIVEITGLSETEINKL